ncbi:MAG TPA: hypothetical protein VIN08_16505 [Ohtaekwangia sp.]|uniref:hypothetical protein n=1 Tax=Ohtaekwangia sp. TaxID=2066019 RepID=UPI002F9583E3
MQVYFDTDYAVITYDENSGVLTGSLKTQPLSLQLREYMYAFLSAMLHFKTGKLLMDTERFGTLHPFDQKWISAKWLSKTMKAGHSHAAIVLPDNAYAQMTLEATMTSAVNEMTFSYFHSTEDALAWLKAA